MKFFARSALCLSISVLAACGGGGSGDAQNLNEDPEVEEPELVLAFDADPLGPDVFNIAAPEESLEQDFNPGEQIRTSWLMTLRYDNDTDLAEGESHLYDATLYLSTDAVIDELDLELFTLECSMPETEAHACGRFASFVTVYAPDNDARFSTTSIPLGKPVGLTDFEVDSTAWLNFIPKDANLIISACLREEPEKCDTFSIGVSLL
jgi:hypothetical protein